MCMLDHLKQLIMKITFRKTILLCIFASCFGRIVKRPPNAIRPNCITPRPDRSVGICTPITSCIPMINLLNTFEDVDASVSNILRKYACPESTWNDVRVCCPFEPIKLPQINSDIQSDLVDHSHHPNAHLLPNNCGMFTSSKVVRGNVAELYEFPWVAAIRYKTDSATDFLCIGSLITNRYILTAAHCIRNPTRSIIGVRLGELNFKTNPDCETFGEQYKFCAPKHQDFNVSISDTIVHPDFNPTTFQNDIAIIRLREEADTTQFLVEPICLPVTIDQKINEISMYKVVGWRTSRNQIQGDILRQAQVVAQNNTECSYNNPIWKELTRKQICVGSANDADICNGDSGGPLMAEYGNDGTIRQLQYGIMSQEASVCNEGSTATYTRVTSYMKWILDNLKP